MTAPTPWTDVDMDTALAEIAALADTLLRLHRRGLIPPWPQREFGVAMDRSLRHARLALQDLRQLHRHATEESA